MMSQNHNYSVWCAAAASQIKIQRRRYFELVTGLLLAVCIVMPTISGRVTAAETMTPLARVFSTPKGQLKSPYPDVAEVADEGYKIYKSLDCGGCHGGGGGGGMAAPLTNPVWIYGDEDDTLFRLITLGTGSLSLDGAFPNQGFVRKGSEAVVGPMPPYGEIIQSEDDLWKIIAWIRLTNSRRHR
jgi:mono/diheme cytochrome c family protein